jgi:hypothetical protein
MPTTFCRENDRRACNLRVIVTSALLTLLASCHGGATPPVQAGAPPAPSQPAPSPSAVVQPAPSPSAPVATAPAQLEPGQQAPGQSADVTAWGKRMSQTPVPGAGCFTASYPNPNWQPTPCKPPPPHRLRPLRGPQRANRPGTLTAGNGVDDVAQSPSGRFISAATGSFEAITGLSSVSDSLGGANSFGLQLNSNNFSTSVCAGAINKPSPCYGWEQFVAANDAVGGEMDVFIEYWLYNYGPCPPSWSSIDTDCYVNTPTCAAPLQSISALGNLRLTATASAGGLDQVVLSTGTQLYTSSVSDSVLNLSAAWTNVEFNVFGRCDGSNASFNGGTSMQVVNEVSDGSTIAPSCVQAGTTGETNNLTLVNPCCSFSGESSRIVFTESNSTPPPTSICACPTASTWNPASGLCQCNAAGTTLVDGKCVNSCGGTGALSHRRGEACGTACGHWTCDGQNSITCQTFHNVCGGCSELPAVPGTGPQPGETCACPNGTSGRYYCPASKVLSCDCFHP